MTVLISNKRNLSTFHFLTNIAILCFNITSLLFQNDREHRPVQPWALICDTLLSRNLKAGTIFQLRQGTDISLLCEVHPLPHFSISEEVIDHATNRFLLRQNSETPVWNKPNNTNSCCYKRLPDDFYLWSFSNYQSQYWKIWGKSSDRLILIVKFLFW